MLSLRFVGRFSIANHPSSSSSALTITAAAKLSTKTPTNTIPVQEPALIKLKSERDPDKLFQLFKSNANNRLVIENRFAFQDTVSRLAGARRFDYIEELLEQQKALPQGRREGFVVRIIMLYGKAGMFKHAVKTFYDMQLYGCKPTVKSFNAALLVLTQTRDLTAIDSFIADVSLKRMGIHYDAYSYNIIIKALCDMALCHKACLIMVEMENKGITPDVITYTTLMSAFYKINGWEIGNGLWNLMVSRGCLPSLATFNVRIQYLANRGRAWQANSLMGKMKYLGIRPDEVTYNMVIKGFCVAGYIDMAKRVYSALHDEGYKPNAKIYQTMIHYLCKDGDFDLAYTMCKDCMNKNLGISVDTIYMLLEGLKKAGNIEKPKNILSLAKKRVPPFSAQQLTNMMSILSRK